MYRSPAHTARILALLCVLTAPFGLVAAGADTTGSTARPLAPDYRVHTDGSVSMRICFNWSCAARERVTFSSRDMARVAEQMALCPATDPHRRLQRVRIGIWQMENLAQKYLPLLANDEPVNDRDEDRPGRMDCVDNASNTTTYLSVLHELDLIPGWTVAVPEVRDRLTMEVHWTAVAVDAMSRERWAVDSWFRGNGHLPFVLPLDAWTDGRIAWKPPFDRHNPYPLYSNQLCPGAPAPDPGTLTTRRQ